MIRDLAAELDAVLAEAVPPPEFQEPGQEILHLSESEEGLSQAAEIVRRAQLARAELTRRECTRSFAQFFRESWPVLEQSTPISWNWHLEVVCDHIQRLFEDHQKKKADPGFVMEYQNLAINVPPGTAKSRMLMVAAPAWAWTRWPGMKFLCLSGNPGNVTRDATKCRQLIESNWYQSLFKPQWALRDDQNSILNYANTTGGERISKGITSKITGDRGDVILVDDPNDVKEAESTSIRNKTNNDWDGAIYNRVNNMAAAVRVQIQQRIHEEDFTGHVLFNGTWAHLKLPLEYEAKNRCECDSCKTDLLGDYDQRTEEGEVLHPDRFPPEVVKDLTKTLGEYGYAGQCQQNPDPARGGKFKWEYWRFWKPDGVAAPCGVRPDRCYKGAARAIPEDFDEICISVDCAFKGKEESDRVAAFVIGRLGADRFLLDRRCDNYDFGETKQIVKELVNIHPRASAVYVEGKANGDAVVSDLRGEISGIISLDPKGGKEARAQVLKPSVEAGQWYVPDGAPWLDDFCHEFAVFPKGKRDDQIDSISQAAVRFQEPEEDESFAAGRLYAY